MASTRCRFERKIELRYKGQKHSLRIDAAFDLPGLRKSFDEAYHRRYGHARPQAPIEFVAVQSTATLEIERPEIERLATATRSPRPVVARNRPVYFPQTLKAWYQRRCTIAIALPVGFSGVGAGGDRGIWVDDASSDHAIRSRSAASGRSALTVRADIRPSATPLSRSEPDPITVEVIRRRLISISDQVDANISRTAFSPLVYEYKDYAVGIVDAEGRLLSQCTGGMPLFVADVLGAAVRDGLALYGKDNLHEGDIVITNDAGTIGQHLNNVVMYTPVYAPDTEEIAAFFVVVVHWLDVGGRVIGSLSKYATDIFQEGIQFHTVKLTRAASRCRKSTA